MRLTFANNLHVKVPILARFDFIMSAINDRKSRRFRRPDDREIVVDCESHLCNLQIVTALVKLISHIKVVLAVPLETYKTVYSLYLVKTTTAKQIPS